MSNVATSLSRLRQAPNLGREIATILTLGVLGIASLVYLLAHEHVGMPLVSKEFTFAADFEKAPGLQLGARQEVRIAGIQVGRITDAEVSPEGRARLSISIRSETPIYQDARLVMESKSPVNLMYVALDPGTPAAGALPADGVIPSSQTRRVTQSFELLDHLDDRARAALTDLVNEADLALTAAPVELPPGLRSVTDAARSFQPVADALATRREHLKQLVTSVSQIATAAGSDHQRLAQLAADLETTLSVVAGRDAELGAALDQLPAVSATLRTSMTSAAELSRELSPTLESLTASSSRLPRVLRSLQETVGIANRVVTKANPVVATARPVVEDLAPLTANLDSTMGDLSPVTSNLPGATAKLVPWLDNLGAFVYNTSSSFSLGDVNGGLGRAHLVLKVFEPNGGGL